MAHPRAQRIAVSAALVASIVLGTLALDRAFPPDLSRLATQGRIIRDAGGEVLALRPAPGGVWRFDTRADEVPPLLIDLLIATEDRRFADHPGVDLRAALRAAGQMARAGHVVSGGSTIAMQVARLLEPRPRTLGAKLIQSARALQLVAHHDRREVLGMWLSLAPFGANLVGVEAASRAWFGKPARSLDVAEAALLVALPRRPEALRPDRFTQRAKAVRDRVLEAARARGVLSAADAARAEAGPVPVRRVPMPSVARTLLADAPADARGDVASTLDGPLQRALDHFAADEAAALPARAAVSVLVADIHDRTIAAGSTAGSTLDLTRAVRSPGSTLKPVLYALAFEDGLAAPDRPMQDRPRRFGTYAPENLSRRFSGTVTAAEALRRSLNLPAVALLDRFGPARFAALLRPAGLRLPAEAEAALPLILGGGGMTLRGLCALYAALADGGTLTPLRLTAVPVAGGPLLDPGAAGVVAAILTRPFPGNTGASGIAWKTGTSAAGRDAWAIGFDARHVVGVWIGRADATARPGVIAADVALPVLARAFALLPAAPRAVVRTPVASAFGLAPAEDAVAWLYPPPDAVLTGGRALTLRVQGGARPLRFAVDGAPLPSVPALRQVRWVPPGPGFYTLEVSDSAGRRATARVRVRAEAETALP